MRHRKPIVRLIAQLAFGLSVLAFLAFFSAQMATHYFESVAERTLREVFTRGIQAGDGGSIDALCRSAGSEVEALSRCDPLEVVARRTLQSSACRPGGLLQLVGKPWRCVARFSDGATLEVGVSLGLLSRHLELALPVRGPAAPGR